MVSSKREILQTALDQVERDVGFIRSLAEARQVSGLSQQDLATRLGWKPEKVQEIEDLKHDPTLGELRRIALAIGVSVEHTATRRN